MIRRSPSLAAFGSTRGERATMARGLGVLFAAGSTLVAVTLLAPHGATTDDAGIWIAVAVAYGIGAALYGLGSRVPIAALHAALLGGSILIAWCVLFGGSVASAYPLMFLWVAIYGSYFFPLHLALGHALFTAVAYGLALWGSGQVAAPALHWFMALGTVVVGGLLISRLTEAVREQTADLAAVARMVTRVGCVTEMARDTCESLLASARGDAVVLMQTLPGGHEMEVTAMAGAAEAGLVLSASDSLRAVRKALLSGEPTPIVRANGGRAALVGYAQPVDEGGRVLGVLAVAWATPRRAIPDHLAQAARLYAAEAGVLLAHAEQQAREKERRALEINDNIVQGLVIAKYAAQAGREDESVRAIEETLAAARRIITDALDGVGSGGEIAPGDLVRARASSA